MMEIFKKIRDLKFLILIFIVFFAAGTYYFLLNEGNISTGSITDEISFDVEHFIEKKTEYENPTNVSREQAMNSLGESEQIIEDMIENELPFVFMNDTLLQAKRIFEQAEYASILREEVNASFNEKLEAQKALRLLDWEEITYDDVIVYTNQIKEKRDKTLLLYDSLVAAKMHLIKESGLRTPITGRVALTESENESTGEKVFISDSVMDEETRELFEEISIAFYEDREEAQDLLIEFRSYLEAKKLESATTNVWRNNLTNFVKRNWGLILFFLFLLGGIIYYGYGKISYERLKEKIKKMKLERKAILQLVKKLQQERFKENKISELVYKIRMKKYKNRLDSIKAKLPVLESKLNRKENRKD